MLVDNVVHYCRRLAQYISTLALLTLSAGEHYTSCRTWELQEEAVHTLCHWLVNLGLCSGPTHTPH